MTSPSDPAPPASASTTALTATAEHWLVGQRVLSRQGALRGTCSVFFNHSKNLLIALCSALSACSRPADSATMGSAGGGDTVLPAPPALTGIFTNSVAQHACAYFSDGSLRCWGYNSRKQVGVLSADDWPRRPTLVTSIDRVVQGTAGWEHTCVLLEDGTGACWGSNEWGTLGNGQIGGGGMTPQPIVNLTKIKSLSFRCALLEDGSVYWWGNLLPGGLSGIPVKVDITGVTAISCGVASCAVMNDETLRCWGGAPGEAVLGDGTTTPRSDPEPVPGLSGVAEAACGASHTCARLTDGTVQCWGDNAFGQLGDGTKISRAVPAPVLDLTTARHVVVGGWHSCALLENGTVWCWGSSERGQLGIGVHWTSKEPVKVKGLSKVISLVAGLDFNCAMQEDRSVLCWGANDGGQLGNGEYADSLVPTPVVW